MSFFEGYEVDDIADDPNNLPNDTYKFKVTQAELKLTKDGSKTGITFRYQIVEGQWSTFYPLVDWVQVPDKGVPKDERGRMLSYLKSRLLAFGFSTEEIQGFGPGSEKECINRYFWGTTSSRKDRNTGNTSIRVVKFDPVGDGADTMVDFGDDNSSDVVDF